MINKGSSPHTRGAPDGLPRRRPQARIIPAYAGSTDSAIELSFGSGDHPRIRGEHQMHLVALVRRVGSSPHTRGALVVGKLVALERRIIPAYAGSTVKPSYM